MQSHYSSNVHILYETYIIKNLKLPSKLKPHKKSFKNKARKSLMKALHCVFFAMAIIACYDQTKLITKSYVSDKTQVGLESVLEMRLSCQIEFKYRKHLLYSD